MRSYPRRVYKSETDTLIVKSEQEEIRASSQGYEAHWKAEKIEARKGTDKEILRAPKAVGSPVQEIAIEAPEKRKRRTKAEMEADGRNG
jgi:hypothetical protein